MIVLLTFYFQQILLFLLDEFAFSKKMHLIRKTWIYFTEFENLKMPKVLFFGYYDASKRTAYKWTKRHKFGDFWPSSRRKYL